MHFQILKSYRKAVVAALIIIFATCAGFISIPAQAQTPSSARPSSELETVRSLSQSLEESFEQTLRTMGRLVKRGDMAIEQNNNYYALTSPHYGVQFENGGRLDVGMIAINVVPDEKDNQWKMAYAWPTPMIFVDLNSNQTTGQIRIGGQRSACLYNTVLKYCSKLDQRFENITLTDSVSKLGGSVSSIRLSNALEENDDKTWSGPSRFLIEGVNLQKDEKSFLDLGTLKVLIQIFDYDPIALDTAIAMLDDIDRDELQQRAEAATTEAEKEAITQDLLEEVGQAWGQLIKGYGNGFKSEFQFEDFILSNPAPESEEQLRIGKSKMGLDLTGFQANNLTAAFRFGYDDIGISPLPEGYSVLAPSFLNMNFSLVNIPFKDLQNLITNNYEDFKEEATTALFGQALLLRALERLNESGAKLNLTDNEFGNDNYTVTLSGTANLDDSASYGFVVDTNMRISNFDFILKTLKEKIIETENQTQVQNMQNLFVSLSMLKGFAETSVGPDGKVVHDFNIIIDHGGSLIVNGTNIAGFTRGINGTLPTPEQLQAPAPQSQSQSQSQSE